MASSRRTGTNENISTFGAGGFGRDYTDLSTWEAATDNNLVSLTQTEVLECYDDATSFNLKIDISGATTNSSYFRLIRPAGTIGTGSWQGNDGTPNNGVFFNITIAGDSWRLDEPYATVQDMIWKVVMTDSSPRSLFDIQTGPAYCIGCIVLECDNNDNIIRAAFEIQDDDVYCINCLALNNTAKGFDVGVSNNCYIYNCNAIGNTDIGFWEDSGTLNIKNCLGDGNSTDFDGGTGNNNASGDATAPGTSNRINQTFTFVNTGNDDYHLDSSDTGAHTFGADLSADGIYAFDDDIDGETRS